MKRIQFYIILNFITGITFFSHAQKNKLEFGFNYSVQNSQMNKVNDYLIDPTNKNDELFTPNPGTYLKWGNKFDAHVSYQFWKSISLGIFANYQLNRSTVTSSNEVYDPIADSSTLYVYNYELSASNTGAGIRLTILYNDLFNFKSTESAFLNRLNLSTSFDFGIGHSKLQDYQIGIQPSEYAMRDYKYVSNHFMGAVSLYAGYEFLQNPFISSIGLSFGYQFNKSGIIHNKAEQTLQLQDQSAVYLNFSGWNAGITLTIGK